MPNDFSAAHYFPPGFLWGTATAAHQVEGDNQNSWTAWEDQQAGHIYQNQVSGKACAWWSGRYKADFDLAASLHNNAIRFSVEWSRIEPAPGRFDDSALAFYRAMAADARARGLEPVVTLHHFTNPIWLEERGGWLHKETPAHFATYALKVVQALADHVTLWCTLNEPLVYATQSYSFGNWPPALKDSGKAWQVVEHMVRGHAAAYHAIKHSFPQMQVGFAKHQITFMPGGLPLLGNVARQLVHWLFNEMIFGPFRTGTLRLPDNTQIRIPNARNTLDWVGLQYYTRRHVRFNPALRESLFIEVYDPPDAATGPPGWGELDPQGIFKRAWHLTALTGRPVYITEAGVPDADDSVRPGYLAQTLRGVWNACNYNFPVKGFFYWSLVDNFEWAEGYDPRYRFGLYGVDFQTQARTERRSARLYRAVCAANALTASAVQEHAPEAFAELFPVPRTQ